MRRELERPEAGRAAVIEEISRRVVACERCPRLRAYCTRVAIEKKRAYRDETYWGRPVPGFGDAGARVLIVGLAPAAHGGNRTGRLFTGDGSADFLMRALYSAGFASIPTSRSRDDGLVLKDAYLTASVRCAPPDNRPLREEVEACRSYLEEEFDALAGIRVIVALGHLAFGETLRLLAGRGIAFPERPRFAHGAVAAARTGHFLIASYHPSRQNTNTGKLTIPMLEEVFLKARALL